MSMRSGEQNTAVLSVDMDRMFQPNWPVNEVVLCAALNSGQTLDRIAADFNVEIADVLALAEEYDLEVGQL